MFRNLGRRVTCNFSNFRSASFGKNTKFNLPQLSQQKRGYAFSGRDEGPKFRNFLLVGLIGTGIFVLVVKRVDQEDPTKSLAKRKTSYSEEEWANISVKRKQLVFKPDEADIYLVPYGSNSKIINNLKNKLEKKDQGEIKFIDLNNLIENQMSEAGTKYGQLLSETKENFDPNSKTCKYTFTYRLASGIFTKLISDELKAARSESPDIKQFVLLNYPNSIKEAVAFDRDVANTTNLVVTGDEKKDDSIVDYFNTVNKVVTVNDL